jgi:hypothetical protein
MLTLFPMRTGLLALSALFIFSACSDEIDPNSLPAGTADTPVLMILDEESIDNGNEPTNFSATDVNDQLAEVGVRTPLQYFASNIGNTITLYSGEVGDEGWHAVKTIPDSWKTAGPTGNGAANFIQAGPGLGSGDNPEVRLDKIPAITPLRATGLKMLEGKTIFAIVYDGDISINYSPLLGNLQGANLGIVALTVLEVTKRTDGSSKSLPKVKVRIENAASLSQKAVYLFTNAPEPSSSSEPGDIDPPATAPQPVFTIAP